MNYFKGKFNFFSGMQPSQKEAAAAPATSMDLVPFEDIGFGASPKVNAGVAPSVAVPLLSIRQAAQVAQLAAEIPAPVKAVARMSVKSAAAGAIVDAALGGYNAIRPLQRNEIDLKQMGIHIVSEGVCGFLTAGAGTAGSISAYMLTGSLGPIVIASGMASSMAVRYGYRCVVGETLPDPSLKKSSDDSDSSKDDFEDIGRND